MFGPYEIEHNGRTYHGDVALVEHHLFERSGVHCLFRVQEMAAVAITPTLAGAISRLIPGCGTLIPDPLMQALRGCGLVAADAAAGAPDKVEGPRQGRWPARDHARTLARPAVQHALCLLLW
jgi:hypothetical protein